MVRGWILDGALCFVAFSWANFEAFAWQACNAAEWSSAVTDDGYHYNFGVVTWWFRDVGNVLVFFGVDLSIHSFQIWIGLTQ